MSSGPLRQRLSGNTEHLLPTFAIGLRPRTVSIQVPVRITRAKSSPSSSIGIPSGVRDIAMRVFLLSTLVSVALTAWLIYGLLSGHLATLPTMTHEDRAHNILLVQSTATWVNVSVLLMVVSGAVALYDEQFLGLALLIAAAALAYAVDYSIDYLQSANGMKILEGMAAKLTLTQLHNEAILIGVPGLLLTVFNLFAQIKDRIFSTDLTQVTYGKNVSRQKNSRALIPMTAKCWQLPFCRETIRKQCPIFHARTKCWKERVGCMCEENIILLAMGGGEVHNTELSKEQGFVPIGDLITRQHEKARAQIPTRAGPRGVRIPTNPHLTAAQKRERCRNCVIYNEHERQKYQFLSLPVTIIVPLLAYLEIDPLRSLVQEMMHGLDRLMGAVTFDPKLHTGVGEQFTSLPIETIVVVCLTLVAMTWAHRLLEYCTFKLKI